MHHQNVSDYQPTKTVKLYFQQMFELFSSENEKGLSNHLKNLYKDPSYNFNAEKWKVKITFENYLTSELGHSFSKIVQQIKQYQIIKAEEGKKSALKYHLNILINILKVFEQIKDAKCLWICGPLRSIVRATKIIFMETYKSFHGATSSIKIDDLMNILQRYKGSRNLTDQVKKQILPLVDNMQISILLVFHNYEQISRILKAPKMYDQGSKFINNYYFQKGKVALINERMKEAEESLQKIKIYTRGQKNLILKYLIPCKMFLGKMFKQQYEGQYFPQYQPLINSLINADFAAYQQILAKFQKLWIKRGIYLLMDKLRIIIWRNLIKKVSVAQGGPKVPIVNIEKAVRMKGGKQELNECVCIISNLIFQGYIKGYIYQSEDQKVLVLKKSSAFPSLSSIY